MCVRFSAALQPAGRCAVDEILDVYMALAI